MEAMLIHLYLSILQVADVDPDIAIPGVRLHVFRAFPDHLGQGYSSSTNGILPAASFSTSSRSLINSASWRLLR